MKKSKKQGISPWNWLVLILFLTSLTLAFVSFSNFSQTLQSLEEYKGGSFFEILAVVFASSALFSTQLAIGLISSVAAFILLIILINLRWRR